MRLTLSILLWELGLYRNSRRRREEILRRNQRRFTRLVSYLQKHSPYYARIIAERKIDPRVATPADFPSLTKPEFIANFDEIVTAPGVTRQRIEAFLEKSHDPADLMDGRYVIAHSSGTSGQLAYCAYTLKEWVQGWTSFFRAVPVFGPLPRKTAFIGATTGHFAAVTLSQTTHWLKIGLFHKSRRFDVNTPWGETLDGLNAFQPHNLSCYGSILGELCAEQERRRLKISPRTIICGGDPLPSADRARAERVFGVPVIDIYATTETSILGITEPKSQGMVLLEDDLWIEWQDDHLLVTNLRNRTTPLIRYVVSDILKPAAVQEGYNYYRGFRRVESIDGRREDKIVLVNESGQTDFIHPLLIVEFFVRGAERFQVVCTGPAAFTFRVKPDAKLSAAEREVVGQKIRAKWDAMLAQKNMRNVRYEVEWVDELRNDPRTGKFRLVISVPTDADDGLPGS